MRVVAFVVGLFLAAVLFTVSGPQVSAQAQPDQEQTQKIYVMVRPGDTLTKIAKRKKTTYKRIFYANKQIKNPDLIFPGQKFRIPGEDEKLTQRPLNSRQAAAAASSERSYRQEVKSTAAHVANGSIWDKLAACESGGNWSINTSNGYYGGLQFSLATWHSVGGSGYPHQHSRDEQIKRGKILQARSGWGQWPACSAKLGLR